MKALLPIDVSPAIVFIGDGGSTFIVYKQRNVDASSLYKWWTVRKY